MGTHDLRNWRVTWPGMLWSKGILTSHERAGHRVPGGRSVCIGAV
jgi:hypothetical protein